MQAEYIAKRSIQSGNTSGQLYALTIDLQKLDKQVRAKGRQNQSLSGATKTILHHVQTVYNLQTVITQDSDTVNNEDIREFLDSVAGGEIFQLDLEGSLEDYILDNFGSPYRARRIGYDEIYTYSFTVRKL